MSDSEKAFDRVDRLFISGNSILVERVTLTRDMWEEIKAWQASRQALSSCSENPNTLDPASCPEIPDSSITGNAVAMGDLTDEEGDLHKKSILIQFASVEDFGAAVKSGQCRFTVFVGDV